MSWVPQVSRMDAGSGPSFTAFDQEILQPDGTHKRVHISSLHQLRQVETDSMTRARNGEGQPLCWRDYSQNRSNQQVHTLMPTTPAEQAQQDLARDRAALPRHRGSFSITKHGADAPDRSLGPGVTDATTSALGGT